MSKRPLLTPEQTAAFAEFLARKKAARAKKAPEPPADPSTQRPAPSTPAPTCARGHKITEASTYRRQDGTRICRRCQYEYNLASRERDKAAIEAMRAAREIAAGGPDAADRAELARVCVRILTFCDNAHVVMRFGPELEGARKILARCEAEAPYPPADLDFDLDWAEDALADILDAVRALRAARRGN